jgi:hypothetical protein
VSKRIELSALVAFVPGMTSWQAALFLIAASVVAAILVAFFRADTPFVVVGVIGLDTAAIIVLLWNRTREEC